EAQRDLHIYNAKDNADADFSLRCVQAGMARIKLNTVFFVAVKRLPPSFAVQAEKRGSFAHEPIVTMNKTNVFATGYRQNYNYFARENSWILNDIFCVPGRRACALQDFGLPSLNGKIVLHVRRGDYASHQHLYSYLPVASDRYYVDALTIMAEKTGLTEAVLFCEEQSREDVQTTLVPVLQHAVPHVQITFAYTLINSSKNKKHAPWHEMLWMSTASAFVIANSSFGWWAAWMSSAPRDKKVVIFPKEWFGLAYEHDLKELPIPDETFGQWLAVSNRRLTTDPTMCRYITDRVCSVADMYELAHRCYDEGTCGPLDRDFSFGHNNFTCRQVCRPSFCVIDLTDSPLICNNQLFKTFTSIKEFLQDTDNDNKWVVFRKDAAVTQEYVLELVWYLMQPVRFGLCTKPSENSRFGLKPFETKRMFYGVMDASLRQASVADVKWWDARSIQYVDIIRPRLLA
ncbi:alpha-1,2-fucosyltransferase, partial [Asticcacaulis sp.]|uniref:alpha-1,2-fucosyltransferase n=1 Tax=Asticcacaulis sp. TaxID=1872648 RepID=UPI00263273C8